MPKGAVFTRRRNGTRKMHAVRHGEHKTVCGLTTGIGSGLVRDGDYWNAVPCAVCWSRAR